MATEREFKLVGSFNDQITKKLKKINSEVGKLSKSFDRFNKRLAPVTKGMNKLADASMRANKALKEQKTGFDSSLQSARQYTTQMRKAYSTAQKLSKVKPPKPMRALTARGGGGGGGGRRSGGGGTRGSSGPGFGTLALATAAGGGGLMMATAAFTKVKNAAMGFVSAGKQAEQATIQMAGTLQTLGKVGDFAKSTVIAESMMKDLSKVAAALPGATGDYLSVLQQTLDDQITAYGSVEAVQKNLAGFDPKTGEKLRGGMESSFTALFGMTAQLAQMRPELAAMDLNQLRASPESVDRNIQIFTRNPTLKKFYLEELKKNGGDFFKALDAAMKKAITPEQVEALKQSYDSALQSLITTFSDPYSGIFGYAKKIKMALGPAGEESVSVMSMLGRVMRQLNGILESLLGIVGSDFLIKGIISFLFEIEVYLFAARWWINHYTEKGVMSIKKFGEIIGNLGTRIGARILEAIATFDYKSFFQAIDAFFAGLIEGIKKGLAGTDFDKIFEGVRNALGEFLGTVSGLLLTLTLAVIAANKQIAGTSLMQAGSAALRRGPARAAGRASLMAGVNPKKLNGLLSSIKKVLTKGPKGSVPGLASKGGGLLSMLGGAGSKNFMAGFKMLGAKIPLIGGAITTLLSLLQGRGILDAITDGLGSAGGAAIGAAIGTVIFPGIGTAIGAALGGWIGTLEPVTSFIKGALQGLWVVGEAVFTPLFDALGTVGGMVWDAIDGILSIIPGLNGLGEGADMARIAFEVVRFTLAPVVGLVQAVQMGLIGLRIVLKHAELWMTKTFSPWRAKRIKKLQGDVDKLTTDAAKKHEKNMDFWDPNLYNKKFNAAGDATAKAMGKVASGADNAAAALNSYQTKTKKLIDEGKVSGLTPSSSDMAWYKSKGGQVPVLEEAATETQTNTSSTNTKLDKLQEKFVSQIKQDAKISTDNVKVLSSISIAALGMNATLSSLVSHMKTGVTKVKMDGGLFGAMGAASAEEKAIGGTAQRFGLTKTSGFRPGDPGWHGVGRAADFSNGSGPTKEMKEFALFLSATVGQNLKELIYTPLGFGIKNGEQVPPYAKGSHMDHVHVAWAGGPQNPAMFDSAIQARQFERGQVGSEVYSPDEVSKNITQNITFNVDGSKDPESVAEAILSAMQQMEAATIA